MSAARVCVSWCQGIIASYVQQADIAETAAIVETLRPAFQEAIYNAPV